MVKNIHQLAYAVAYITFLFGLLTSLLRFYSRAVLVKQWGWDDSVSVPMMVGTRGMSKCLTSERLFKTWFLTRAIIQIVSIIHQWVLQLFLDLGCGKPNNVECSFASLKLLKGAFIQEIVIYSAHFVIKVTFLLFYLRLNQELAFRKWVFLGFALNGAVYLTNLLLTVLQCIPFEKILNPILHPEVKCLDPFTVIIVPPILNIAMDIYIITLPIPTIWKLQMTLRRKLTVLSVLGFGIVSMIVVILRLPVLVSVTSGKSDVSKDVGIMIIVTAFEIQCGIVSCNLPSLKAMWTTTRDRLGWTSSGEHSSSKGYELSTQGRKPGGNRNGIKFGGVITRLEHGLNSNESEEELFREGQGQSRIQTATGDSIGQSSDDDQAQGAKYGLHSIVVTTNVDVVATSSNGRQCMPSSYLGFPGASPS